MNQSTVLKKMTGEARMEQAFELSDLVRELSLLNIQKMYPNLSASEKRKKLYERIERARKNGSA